jgi:CTP:molybdopterin cytidylyltransferase MocA
LRRTGKIIITKEHDAEAVLMDISEYENICSAKNRHRPAYRTGRPAYRTGRPALMVLGAKSCPDSAALKTINNINSVSEKYFSKIIFVYGGATKKYVSKFKTNDLRTVFNKKNNLPIITSLKCGITALSPSEKYFIIVFLSQPQDRKTLILMSNAALKSNKKIIISRRNGQPVHPIAFSTKFKKVLIKTRKELGIPYIIKKFRNEVQYADI